eukprot:356133-Chlamydomonas_euryale.AAC.10
MANQARLAAVRLCVCLASQDDAVRQAKSSRPPTPTVGVWRQASVEMWCGVLCGAPQRHATPSSEIMKQETADSWPSHETSAFLFLHPHMYMRACSISMRGPERLP